MNQEKIDLFYGAMLHDIGKLVQRATLERTKHSQIGKKFLQKFDFNQVVLDQVAYHHGYELSQKNLSSDHLAYITYIADNIASGLDRRKHDETVEGQLFKPTIPLEDVFNRFGTESASLRYYEPQSLDVNLAPNYPDDNPKEFTSSQYTEIMNRIENTLNVIDHTPEYMDSLMNLLEATLAYVPSSTNLSEVADISLYDHIKMTAAIALCIYEYMASNGRTDFQNELFNKSDEFYNEDVFLLASFDLSGIQDFIYTIASSGAHKQLRSRSFYLDMLAEWLADTILKELDLNRANLLYSGGGHAYLILANTEETIQILRRVEYAFNQFFLNKFGTKLYVAFGWTPFSSSSVMEGNTPQEYRAIFQRVNRIISEKKLKRYQPDTIKQLNSRGKYEGRECAICHTISHLVEEGDQIMCQTCYGLRSFARDIQHQDFFVISNEETPLQIGPKAYLKTTNDVDILDQNINGLIYSKNKQITGKNQAVHIWVADYSAAPNNEFSYFAERSWTQDEGGNPEGVGRLGVLRADVDDLGFGFMAGYSYQGEGRYNTLSRTASFSRNMSLFFKQYINQIASDYKVLIVYSGGDDVFAVGAWDEIINFAVVLREDFDFWTNGKLTLSAGIGMFSAKTPINIMARETGDLEEAAKNSGKNAICLFEDALVFPFDTFINDVQGTYLEAIMEFFDEQSLKGKSFIYRLLQLIEERDEQDRISFARLAYVLARLEDEVNKSSNKTNIDVKLERFNTFKLLLMEAFNEQEELKKFDTALRLYVYKTRKVEK